ncbi:ribonuclease H-like domain-containing protein [Tanacetum coccineum]|uniref:Ribonuclease H-like domain-containing protein n=1 Tax=Tanacetum coccineum TaxID=301880 RepID=A0ABQ5BGH7_9ASTR
MEDTMLDLLEICRQKELYCIHNNVENLIESALNSKLLLINLNSQRLQIRSTIPEKESDEFIKSSVEDLILIPRESEDSSGRLFSPPNLDLSNSGLEEFQQPEFEGYGPKTSKSVSKDTSNEFKESPDASLVEELVSNDKSQTSRGNQRNWNNQKSQQLGSDFVMYSKTCFVCGSFNHVQANCNYHQRKRMVSENNYTRVNYNYSAKKAHPNAQRNIVPRVILMKTGLRPLNTVRPVNTAHPKTTVYSARPMSCFSKSAQSTGHPQKEDQGYVDSECSRHMIGNMSYLSDFKEFDRGYVAFGGGAKGGRIAGKGTLKTGKLDFEDVYFVNELQFNLFSVLQMCDKKNSVLFTDTGCFVLSPDFKLADESQVLLKVSRKNNMYSVDIKNIVPKESLTCLVANVTLDESMLWHRRLGHNRVLVVKPHNKTPYELFRGRTPSLSFMKPFGCHVTILNTLDHLGKFDGKSDDGFFVGNSLNSTKESNGAGDVQRIENKAKTVQVAVTRYCSSEVVSTRLGIRGSGFEGSRS